MEKASQIFPALAAIMNDVEPIQKNKRNQQQGFMYRGIDDMYNELQPLFVKHKVFIASEVLKCTREERTSKSGGMLLYTVLKVRFTFYAADGSSVSSVMVGEAMDNGDKGANKAMSVALKYCLMQLLLIPTEELKRDDPDGQAPQSAGKKAQQAAQQQPATQQQPAAKPLSEAALQQWRDAFAKCDSLDTLENFKKDKKDKIEKYAETVAMYNTRKETLSQNQTATA